MCYCVWINLKPGYDDGREIPWVSNFMTRIVSLTSHCLQVLKAIIKGWFINNISAACTLFCYESFKNYTFYFRINVTDHKLGYVPSLAKQTDAFLVVYKSR